MSATFQPPTVMSRIRRNAGVLILFTALTSTSLNCSVMIRERREERRQHRLQCAALAQLRSSLLAQPSSSKVTLEEQRVLVRRLRAIQIDPQRVGLAASLLPLSEQEERLAESVRNREISWKRVMFGDNFGGKIRAAMGKTVNRIIGREPAPAYGVDGQLLHDGEGDADSSADEAEWIKAVEEAVRLDMAAEGNARSDAALTPIQEAREATLRVPSPEERRQSVQAWTDRVAATAQRREAAANVRSETRSGENDNAVRPPPRRFIV